MIIINRMLSLALLISIATIVPAASESKIEETRDSVSGSDAQLNAFRDGESRVFSLSDLDSRTINLSKIRVTLIHNTPPGRPGSISVLLSFHQYNKTENDKGDHEAGVTLQLRGASDNILRLVWGGNNITRDACRDLGDHLFGPENIPDDIWPLITTVQLTYYAKWNYEGGC